MAATSACGLLGRPAALGDQVRAAKSPDDLQALRGVEPLVVQLWDVSIARETTPERALATAERGLRFHRGQPSLLAARLGLLATSERSDELLEAVDHALGSAPDGATRAMLRWYRTEALLSRGALEDAGQEVVRLGALAPPPDQLAMAWASLAMAQQREGHEADATTSLQASLDWGPRGVQSLRQAATYSADQRAAARQLLERARELDPEQPDVSLLLVLDDIDRGEWDAARQALATLPRPLPARLGNQTHLLEARVDILSGQVDQGLATLLAHLDRRPGDEAAVLLLFECRQRTGQPPEDEFQRRLEAARPYLLRSPLRTQLESMLGAKPEAASSSEGSDTTSG